MVESLGCVSLCCGGLRKKGPPNIDLQILGRLKIRTQDPEYRTPNNRIPSKITNSNKSSPNFGDPRDTLGTFDAGIRAMARARLEGLADLSQHAKPRGLGFRV